MKNFLVTLLSLAVLGSYSGALFWIGHREGARIERIAKIKDTACSVAYFEEDDGAMAVTEKISVSGDHRTVFVKIGNASTRIISAAGGKLRVEISKELKP